MSEIREAKSSFEEAKFGVPILSMLQKGGTYFLIT